MEDMMIGERHVAPLRRSRLGSDESGKGLRQARGKEANKKKKSMEPTTNGNAGSFKEHTLASEPILRDAAPHF
ncbi:MAG: hypothetical protein Q9215_007485 [Flavoplaca cf. flavocitrina]